MGEEEVEAKCLGLVVQSTGLNFLTRSISPVSATTVLISRRRWSCVVEMLVFILEVEQTTVRGKRRFVRGFRTTGIWYLEKRDFVAAVPVGDSLKFSDIVEKCTRLTT